MSKEIIAVFQDCVLCGDKGRRKIAEFAKKGINIRKVGFITEEGRELCRVAVLDKGIRMMPFFTDGENFATSIEKLLEKPEKITKKITKTTKKVKESEDGADSES